VAKTPTQRAFMIKDFAKKYILPTILIVYFSLFFMQKINFQYADLGRHIKNGENIVLGSWNQKLAVLSTNYYSYTDPAYNFINHHWLTGVVFFLIYKLGSFPALSIFYAVVSGIFVYILFQFGRERLKTPLALFLLMLLLPVISLRTEVRPELFTNLFFVIYIFMLSKVSKKMECYHYVLFGVMQLFWVNLHNYFVFSFLIAGAFAVEAYLNKDKETAKKLLLLIGILFAISFINPNGYKTLVVPLNVVRERYAIKPDENNPLRLNSFENCLLFGFFVSGVLSFFLKFFSKNKFKDISYQFLLIIFSLFSLVMSRMIPLFGIILYFNVVLYMGALPKKLGEYVKNTAPFLLVLSLLVMLPLKKDFGIGLMPNVEDAGHFYVDNNIQGPLFNDYNVGSYLIYYISDFQKVYTDNRPEAYSLEFYRDNYLPLIDGNTANWNALDAKFKFNVIVINADTSMKKFVLTRLLDTNWTLVFADNYAYIFLKNNDQNRALIEKYRQPADKIAGLVQEYQGFVLK